MYRSLASRNERFIKVPTVTSYLHTLSSLDSVCPHHLLLFCFYTYYSSHSYQLPTPPPCHCVPPSPIALLLCQTLEILITKLPSYIVTKSNFFNVLPTLPGLLVSVVLIWLWPSGGCCNILCLMQSPGMNCHNSTVSPPLVIYFSETEEKGRMIKEFVGHLWQHF